MYDKIDKKKLVYSFDLFDTLVCRAVQNPRVVFGLMEQHCSIEYKNVLYQAIGFRKLRILSEKLARKKSSAEDISYDEIYRQVAFFVNNWEELQQKELEIEMAVIYPLNDNLALLEKLQQQGKNCCITSDMYLSFEFIKKLVADKLGLMDIKIFLSSELKKTKHSGNLYYEIADFYGCTFENIFHVGDNEYADIYQANQLGIKTLAIENYNTGYKGDNLFLSLKTPYRHKRNVFYDLGFEVSGICAWAVARWINQDLQKKGIKKIFWGARDGFLFNKIFQKISDIESIYFRTSRRALFLPSFAIDNNHLDLLFEGERLSTAQDFFARLGLSCPDELQSLVPIEHQEKFLRELKAQNFFEICKNEYRDFIRYIDTIGFKGSVAFFDLGWRGSLQRVLQHLLPKETQIEGYYFGLNTKKQGTPQYNAYYFYKNTCFNRYKSIKQALAFFEFLFTEPVQSLKRTRWLDDKLIYETIDKIERQELLEYRQQIMYGAEDFFEVILNLSKVLDFDDKKIEKDIEEVVQNIVNDPSDDIIEAFSVIECSATFGGSYTKYIVEPGEYNLNAYRWSFWRSAYIKKAYGKKRWLGRLIHFVFYTNFLNGFLFYKKIFIEICQNFKK